MSETGHEVPAVSDSIRSRFRDACERRYTRHTDDHFGAVMLRSLSEAERMAIEFGKLNEDGEVSADAAGLTTARLIIATVCDLNKQCVFTDDDLDWLAELDSAKAEPLRKAINAHVRSGTVEAAKKN